MNLLAQCAKLAACAVLASCAASAASAEEPVEDDYYRLAKMPIPESIVLEVGALEWMPEGRLAVGTRRGDIYLIDNPLSDPPDPRYVLYASGLHEVLGLAYRDGWLYATQRGEVTRLRDTTGDGRADMLRTVSDGWAISGDYHEYAFGSKFDRRGQLWVVLCLTGSFSSECPYRGWCLRVSPQGDVTPTCSGIRSPGGIGMNSAGDMFYTDNQGPWNGTCGLKHLQPGVFQGHPGGNRWYELPAAAEAMGRRPDEPRSGSRMIREARRIPQLMPTAVYFPYKKMGQSASGIVCDTSGGKFGPFPDQLLVGDQTLSTVMRCCLEKVDGRYQGACFPFRGGFESGSVGMLMTDDGAMFVGGTARGWGSRGGKPFSLARLQWTGRTPFEVQQMRARPDGFELTFTQPVDPATAAAQESYRLETYTYIYHATYGSPEVDRTTPAITGINVAPGGKAVQLQIDQLQPGHVHELHLRGVRSQDGLPLLHPEAYYTLNSIPQQ